MTTTSIPFPAGANFVDAWEEPNTPDAYRYWAAPRLLIPCKRGDVEVWVGGLQHADGRLEPEICVNRLHSDEPITAAQARQIARALINAADAIERQTDEG